MFGKDKSDKINKILIKKMDIMFEFEFNGLLLLYGESLRNLMMNNKVNNYNFILLTLEKDNVLNFFKKYKLKYEKLSDNEYNFIYKDSEVNLVILDDLTKGMVLNTDFLFYDILRKQFIPVGIKYSVKDRKIYDLSYVDPSVNYKKSDLKVKEEEAKKFIQFLRGDNKKIRIIRKNKFWRMFVNFLKHPGKIK